MRFRFGLAARISLLAIGNFALLGLVFAIYVRMQLSADLNSFLMTAARERIIAISRQIALDLEDTAGGERARLLERYSSEYRVTFYLFLNSGEQLAGAPVTLPSAVASRLDERPGRGAPYGLGDPPGPPPPQRAEAPPDPVDDPRAPRREGPEGDRSRRRPPRPGDPFLVETTGKPRYWVGVRMPIPAPDEPHPLHGTLIIASSSLWTNSFFFQLTPWLVMGGVASAISVLCWFPFVRGTTRAVHKMLAATSTISTGRFDVDAASPRRDELGELGASINRMAGQLDSLVRGQKRFLADAAHELRSPLGRMQLAAGILERRADDEEARYIADLKEDVEMLSDLTDELLVFARAESTPPSRIAPVEIAPLIERAIHMERREGADIRIELTPGLRALADETTLCRSVANVVRNSIRYAGQAGPIRVSAVAANGQVLITVSDEGPGVPADALEKIFTPFYRLDESRNRKTGGAGLGLAIVKTSIEACGGSVECRNRVPSGLETTLRLKRAV
jgi:two-component system sensor histidine kinase CpxA